MIHQEPHPQSGQTVRIRSDVKHPQYPEFGGLEFRLEDWWDRVAGKSWLDCNGNPACLIYALRAGSALIPPDDEVVYGKVDGMGSLLHVSEIEPGEAPE